MFFVNYLKNFTFAVILSEGVIMSAAKNLFPESHHLSFFAALRISSRDSIKWTICQT